MACPASRIRTAPGCQLSADLSRSVRPKTASRSETWASAHSAAFRARVFSGGCGEPCDFSPASDFSGDTASGDTALLACPDCSAAREAVLDFASRTSAGASRPRSAACVRQLSRRAALSTSRLRARVMRAARSARRGLSAVAPSLLSNTAASISLRRVENASMVSRDTPAISKRPSAWLFSIV